MNLKGLTITPLGDAAIIINFENRIDETLSSSVLYHFEKIKKISFPFVKDIVPGYSSLVIFYDLLIMNNQKTLNKFSLKSFTDQITNLIKEDIEFSSLPSRKIKIPLCYSEKYALDINSIANKNNISVDDVITLHSSTKYRVYMIGFLPGFAYMGPVDERIAMARKTQPRTVVEAGSVGIAGRQTGIYPLDSPGGWQIIGKTPLKIFDKKNDEPVLLQPGDEIEFYPITEDEFTNY